MEIQIREIVKAVSGRLLRGDESRAVRAISLDSRQMEGDDLFVPLVGEKVDAHRFICPVPVLRRHK